MKKRVGIAIVRLALALVALVAVGLVIAYFALPLDLDKLDDLGQVSRLYDGQDGEVATLTGAKNRTNVPLQSIPVHVQNAFIAAEDARFYDHFGVDIWRMNGALLSNIKSGSYSQGASTITQQLIKLTLLTSEKTLTRKLKEILLAIKLERVLTKEQILERYLNTVYFGAGAYGIQAASQTYFGVDVDKLDLQQGALLAAVIKSPTNYDPAANPERAQTRRDLVLSYMVEYEFLSDAEAEAAKREPLSLASQKKQAIAHPWYLDQATVEAANALQISVDDLLCGGYHIYTALNVALQSSAESLFANAKNFPANAADGTKAEAALVCADPQNGEVLCLIGGRDYQVQRGLNRASSIKRQPGSALKPVSVFAAAIDQLGYLPVSMVEDVKRDFGGGYSPRNVGGTYHGTVTLREALSRSLNAASVDLITKTGIDSALRYAERAGLAPDENDANLSFALGSMTYGVSPMQLGAAYAPLSNGGRSVQPHLVRRIVDRDGHVVFERRTEQAQVMRPESAYMITSMLQSAVRSGSAQKLSALNFDVAAKTGTVSMGTSGNRDIWTVGYTPTLSVSVWMGFDQPDAAHKLPDSASGSAQPCALVTALLKDNAQLAGKERFAMPNGLVEVLIDQRALQLRHRPMLASSATPKSLIVREVFPKGKAPTQTSDVWVAPTRVFDLSGELSSPTSAILVFTSLQEDAVYRLYRLDAQAPVLVAELAGPAGRKLRHEDLASYERAEYYVIPVHKELLAEGVLLEGKASKSVRVQKPFGFADWIFFETPKPSESPVPIPEQEPLLVGGDDEDQQGQAEETPAPAA